MRAKFLRYLLAGGFAAIVDLSAFMLLLSLGIPLAASAALAFVIAAVVNFTLSSRHVFDDRIQCRRFPLFLFFAICGMTINTAVTVFSADPIGAPAPLAKILGIGVAFLFNFSVNALIVFPASRRSEPDRKQPTSPDRPPR